MCVKLPDEWHTVVTLIRCHVLRHLILIYVCSGLSVWIRRIIFHGPQDVRAFKVWLYNVVICHLKQMSVTACLVPIENWCVYVSVSVFVCVISLWKHAYLDILKILPPKNKIFQIKNSNILHISAQNIDCGYSLEPPRWGSSNEYPQSIF